MVWSSKPWGTTGSAALYPAARLRWLPWWVLGVGMLATLALVAWSFQRENTQRRDEMAREARGLTQALQGRVQAYTDTLPGLRVFGLLYQTPNDAEFLSYIESISLQERFPELALTFMGEWVEEARREFFEAGVQGDRSLEPEGHPDFHIKPAGARPHYMVLRHVYPADPPAFGYDLFDPSQNYRRPVEQAIDSGQAVATPPLRLARDREKPDSTARTSVVVRTAIYLGGRVPASVEERRSRLLGVAGVAFRIEPLMLSVFKPGFLKSVAVRVLDAQMAPDDPGALLFESEVRPQADPSLLLWQGQVAVADRQWTVQTYRRGVLAGLEGTLILLVFGAGLSLGLAAITRSLARANVQAEARFSLLFEHSFDAVISVRRGGLVLAANRAACLLFGATEDELQRLSRAELIDPSDDRLPAFLAERDRGGRSVGHLRMRRADGSSFEAEIASNMYSDLDGQQNISMIIRDVTERQRIAFRLQEKQRLESIGTLAGGVAHDFNNMLAGILGNVALAEERLPTQSPARPHLRLVRRAADRARSLVRQILTFGRRLPQQQQVQPLQPLVQEAVALLGSTVPKNVDLLLDMPEAPLGVCVDAAQLQQVVLNLCTNAWQALHDRPGEVRVSVQAQALDSAQAQTLGLAAGDYVALAVSDDGPGFDSTVQARLFEPFFTTKDMGEGTGLGLAVVHGVVSESGGAIRVDSSPGAGACFTVLLPRHLVAEAEGQGQGPGHGEGGGISADASSSGVMPLEVVAPAAGQRVLYVDDDEVVALTAAALLEHAGFRVDCMSRGLQALQAVLAQPGGWDVIVTDYNMPGMTGLELARALHDRGLHPAVIIISGLLTDEVEEAAGTLGLAGVLPKENMLESLVEMVRLACRQSTPKTHP
jgi:PAS domain S-box-containing protein